jgi:D-aspartate ligase
VRPPLRLSQGGLKRPIAETPILILGLAGLSMHHGALGAIRSVGRLGVPVFLAHGSRRAPIDRSRYCCGSLVLAQEHGDTGTLESLLQFGAEHRGAILLAVDDAGAMFVDDHGGALAEVFLLPHQPSGLARALADKREMHRLCLEHDVPTPDVACPESEADALEYAAGAAYPVVVKRIDASLPMDSPTPNVLLARNREELLTAYHMMASHQVPNVMLQEYIPETPQANWMFNGYFDERSRCRLAFTGQKLRQAPPDAGATTLGVCRPNPLLARTTERFMQAVGYRGILDADYRLDPRDGRYKLLDVNPRIGSSFRLFVADDGMDVLRAMYLDLTEQAPPTRAEPRDGRRWVVEPQDLQSSLTYLRQGNLTPRRWLGSLRHVDETAWWARDDPGPLFALLAFLSVSRLRGYVRSARKGIRLRRAYARAASAGARG